MPPIPFNLENYKRKVKKKVILLMHGENISPDALAFKKDILPEFKSFNLVSTSYSLSEVKSLVKEEKIYLIIFDHNYFIDKEEEFFKEAEKGKTIFGLDLVKDSVVFHAGTKAEGDKVVTNGGRVLAVSAWGSTLYEALEVTYRNAGLISWNGMYYRTDIGFDLL